MMNRTLKPMVATAVALLSLPALAAAGDWSWNVTPYVWATAATVDVEIDDRDAFESTVDFADLIDDADFAGMFHSCWAATWPPARPTSPGVPRRSSATTSVLETSWRSVSATATWTSGSTRKTGPPRSKPSSSSRAPWSV